MIARAAPPHAPRLHLLATLKGDKPFASGLDPDVVEEAVAALVPGGTRKAHHFLPQGLSLTVNAPPLTVVLHTWPERGVCTLDLVAADAESADQLLRALCDALSLVPVERTFVMRGDAP